MRGCTCDVPYVETCPVHVHPEYRQANDAPSETLRFAVADLENAVEIALIGRRRPWRQRAVLIDCQVDLGKIRGLLEREGVL